MSSIKKNFFFSGDIQNPGLVFSSQRDFRKSKSYPLCLNSIYMVKFVHGRYKGRQKSYLRTRLLIRSTSINKNNHALQSAPCPYLHGSPSNKIEKVRAPCLFYLHGLEGPIIMIKIHSKIKIKFFLVKIDHYKLEELDHTRVLL